MDEEQFQIKPVMKIPNYVYEDSFLPPKIHKFAFKGRKHILTKANESS